MMECGFGRSAIRTILEAYDRSEKRHPSGGKAG